MTDIGAGEVGANQAPYQSIADRLERLPFSSFHRKFLLMVTAGEFVETMMLLGNGTLLALIAVALKFSSNEATTVVPDAFFAGEFVGSIAIGYLSDRFGRRRMFAYDLLIFGIAMIVAGFWSNPFLIAIFIFIGGIGVGGEFPLVDTYTTEVFPGHQRGRRLAFVYTLAVIAAPVIAVLAFAAEAWVPGFWAWRVLFWIIGILSLIVWLIRLGLPESPRWFEVRGRDEEAERGVGRMEQDAMREHNLTELPPAPSSVRVKQAPARWRDIWAADLRPRTIMMLVFQFFQSGIFYGFTSLAPTILLTKGISLVHTLVFSMIIYCGFLVGSIVNIFIIDRVERKWGIVVTAILAGVIGTIFVLVPNVTATVILGFFVAFVLWNFSNFQHTYQAELFPTRVRSMAAGTTYSVSRISTSIFLAIITAFFLPRGLLATYGFIWFLIVVAVVVIAGFGPKTSRLRLEAIGQ
ncbi:MAG: MFS transporter [Candidatus Dormibacteraceae bacterium]